MQSVHQTRGILHNEASKGQNNQSSQYRCIDATPPPPSGDGLQLNPVFFPRRLDADIDPVLYDQLDALSRRSGRSIAEIAQELISRSYLAPVNLVEIDG
jgi:hypothetical protein